VGFDAIFGPSGLEPRLVDRSKRIVETRWIWPQQRFLHPCSRWFLWGRAEVDFDFFYFVSFNREEFRVPGTAAILGFAIVEDEGFVVSFKHLLNLIGWGLLAIGPAAFEIGFAVNAIVVRTGKYEVVAQ
jgi:hypothetical protein